MNQVQTRQEPSQLTLDSEPKEIPIRSKTRKPLSSNEQKIYNYLRRSWKPLTYQQIESVHAFQDIKNIRRTIRRLREKHWIRRIPEKGPNPKWEAIF